MFLRRVERDQLHKRDQLHIKCINLRSCCIIIFLFFYQNQFHIVLNSTIWSYKATKNNVKFIRFFNTDDIYIYFFVFFFSIKLAKIQVVQNNNVG